MIPALGANAGEGDVKLVTPVELGDPAPQGSDSRFDGLDSLDYVTTAVRDRALGETRGTLYVVVEDNDEDSNAHINSSLRHLVPLALRESLQAPTADSTEFTTSHAALPRFTIDGIPTATVVGTDVAIADRNRDGFRDQSDVSAVRVVVDGLVTTATPLLTGNLVAITDSSVEILNAAVSGATEVRISVATATENDLTDAAGEALVTVRSTSDSGISVHANERNLTDYRRPV